MIDVDTGVDIWMLSMILTGAVFGVYRMCLLCYTEDESSRAMWLVSVLLGASTGLLGGLMVGGLGLFIATQLGLPYYGVYYFP